MAGHAPNYKDELNEQQTAARSKTAHSHTALHDDVVRAKILMLVAGPAAYTNQQVARQVGCTDRTVRKWR